MLADQHPTRRPAGVRITRIFANPSKVFKWAAPGRAYAAQIGKGPSGKFYLYAPVVYAAATTKDKFAIGVAVADSPLGPWIDAHPAGSGRFTVVSDRE